MTTTVLILSAWLSLAGFSEPFTCTVTGTVWEMPGDEPDFVRSDGCRRLIEESIKDGKLVLVSRRWIVTILLPNSRIKGNRPFWYIWGRDVAHLGDEIWPIASISPIVPG
jgi:hypothetical protein